MAYTTIDKSDDYFNTVLYTGNGTAIGSGGNAITGVGFQPDWVWIKSRTQVEEHEVFDPVRGVTKYIRPSTNAAEVTDSESLTSFDADGFTVGDHGQINANSQSFVSWNWLADNTSGSSNADGSITSTVSANTTSGFSIVSYTGTGSDATVGHGLGVTPKIIFWKRRDNTAGAVNWIVQSTLFGNQTKLVLNTTEAFSTNATFSQTNNWDSLTIDLKTYEGQNSSGGTYIAYCFAEKQGFSKFGSYVGNGNADGTFVYTGFKPAFVIQKNTSAVQGWQLQDNKREGYNGDNDLLQPNDSAAESGVNRIDILSNGFKVITTDAGQNTSGSNYFFMAFAENPFVTSTGIAGTAR